MRAGHQQQHNKVMMVQTVNPRVVAFEYAVRGELAIRAEEIKSVRLSLFQTMQVSHLRLSVEITK